jgi:broad specificity phosphatase PhoE
VPKGESFNSFCKRTFDGLEKILEEADSKKIAVVSHHRVERLVKAWIAKGCPDDHAIDLSVFLMKGEKPGNYETITVKKEKE